MPPVAEVEAMPTIDYFGEPGGTNLAWSGTVLSRKDADNAKASFDKHFASRVDREISIGDLDAGIQIDVRKATVLELIQSGRIKGNPDFPISVLKRRGGDFVVLDGHHRVFAAKRLGQKKIPVRVVTEPMEKVLLSPRPDEDRDAFGKTQASRFFGEPDLELAEEDDRTDIEDGPPRK